MISTDVEFMTLEVPSRGQERGNLVSSLNGALFALAIETGHPSLEAADPGQTLPIQSNGLHFDESALHAFHHNKHGDPRMRISV